MGLASRTRSGRAHCCPGRKEAYQVWAAPSVDKVEDLRGEPDVGVILLLAVESIRPHVDLAWAMDRDEEDPCLIAHRPEIPSDAV